MVGIFNIRGLRFRRLEGSLGCGDISRPGALGLLGARGLGFHVCEAWRCRGFEMCTLTNDREHKDDGDWEQLQKDPALDGAIVSPSLDARKVEELFVGRVRT